MQKAYILVGQTHKKQIYKSCKTTKNNKISTARQTTTKTEHIELIIKPGGVKI